MSVFVTYPRAGDSRGGRRPYHRWNATPPACGWWQFGQRSGEWGYASGVASAESGGADSDRGEWGVGREKRGAVVGTSGGGDSSSKDDASKGGAPSSSLKVKFLNSQAVKPAGKSGPARQSGQRGNLGLPGSQACREIWACRANRAKNHAAPAGSGGRKETTPGRKENALATKK